MMRSFSLLCVMAAVLCSWHHVAADTIIIESVTCQRVATGIDNWVKVGARALGALWEAREPLQEIAGAVASGNVPAVGKLPLTAKEIYSKAKAGWDKGKKAMAFIDSTTSGTDDLIINISGEQVWPTSGHGSINGGDTITPDITFDFDGKCRIQFIEYDSGSDNDNLGFIDIEDDVSPGKDYRVEDAILFNEEEGDLYKVTYRVERNDRKGEAKWLLCGTAACRKCGSNCCKTDSNKGLDRDGDEEEVRTCPPGFSDRGWITYDLWWPADDVYLRICGNSAAGSDWCSRTVEVEGYSKSYDLHMANLAEKSRKSDAMLAEKEQESSKAGAQILRSLIKKTETLEHEKAIREVLKMIEDLEE